MSLTRELTGRPRVGAPRVDPSPSDRTRPTDDDALVVTCAACGTRQQASGRALGYTCQTCGSVWQVLRCPGCRKASVVLEGTTTCPRCGHEHQAARREGGVRTPTWLTEPDPLSVWLGNVKYLGGHADRDQPVVAAGLLLDRRGIHLRAFSELFSIRWDTVLGINIEGPLEISERMTTTRLLALGATTWAMQVAYLTVRTENGDAIFEVDGLGPPQLHARLSRVLQGLQRSEPAAAPIALERGTPPSPATDWVTPTVAPPPPPPPPSPAPAAPVAAARTPAAPAPIEIDLEQSDAPLEVLVVDALWKLAHLREVGLLDESEVRTLRARLLDRLSDTPSEPRPGPDPGPLLHV
jgi:predicted RNA-binding Zn-ribbon protein involved in translation (DUF1610 family)